MGELQGGNFYVLAGLAAVFMVARLSHGFALAFTSGNAPARGLGFLLKVVPMAIGAVYNVTLLT